MRLNLEGTGRITGQVLATRESIRWTSECKLVAAAKNSGNANHKRTSDRRDSPTWIKHAQYF